MADVKFNMSGIDGIVKKMRAIPVALRKKPARSALGKGATVLRKQAKTNAASSDDPETGRKIADNIVQRFRGRFYKRTGDLMISVGVGTEKGRIPEGNPDTGPKGNTPHWHLVEEGTELMPAQPFLRPAAEQAAEQVFQTFCTELDKEMDKLVKNA